MTVLTSLLLQVYKWGPAAQDGKLSVWDCPGDTVSWCDGMGNCGSTYNPWRPTIFLFDEGGKLLAMSVRGEPGATPLGVNCTLGTSLQDYPVARREARLIWLDGWNENDYGNFTLYVGFT